MGAMRFDPAGSFSGNVVFNYHATDNSGLLSNSTTYTIPVTGVPPVSSNVLAPKIPNSNGPTAIPILNSADADGSIASYVINNIPPASQGVLSYNNGVSVVPVTAGLVLTPAQIATLLFAPASTFTGTVIFNYAAFDNNGNISNVATYSIPTGTVGALPIGQFIDLVGKRIGRDIDLNWSSFYETNLNNYEVEYSTNATNFYKAGSKIALNGAINSYQLMLNNFTEPLYYLRLKIIETNGSFKYSNVVVIKLSGKNEISIYPNPAETYINIDFGNTAKGNYSLGIFDATGRLLRNELVANTQSNQFHTIFRNTLVPGIYYLTIKNITTNTTVTKRIVFK